MLHPIPVHALCGAFGLLIGVAAVLDPRIALLLSLVVAAALAFRAPTAAWVGAAVAVVLLVRLPTTAGLLPQAAVQLPIVLAWVALALALVRTDRAGGPGGRVSLLLGVLVVAIAAAGLAAATEPLRTLFYLSLIGTPFALLAAVLLDPPDARWRRYLIGMLMALIVVQIPVVLAQTLLYTTGDFVRGTLIGSDIGAHQVSPIAVVGAIWLTLSGPHTKWTIALILLLLAIPFLAGANQVIFAIPIGIVVAALAGRGLIRAPAVAAIGGLLLLLLLLPGWNSGYARDTLGHVGESLKAEPAGVIVNDMADDPLTLLFGHGPATTVSTAALLTADGNAVIEPLGLEPATFPADLESYDAPGSIQRPVSSVLGIVGDLGLLGAIAFTLLFAFVFDQTRRRGTPLALAATAGLAMILVLGFFNDAFEQPPFALFLALVAGLALTDPSFGASATRATESPPATG